MVKTTSTNSTKPLKTDKGKNNIEGDIRSVVENAITYYENLVFPEALEIIRFKQLDTTDRAVMLYEIFGKEYKFRSNECYPLIATAHDTFTSNLYDTDTKARAIAFHEEDQPKAEMAQDFWDWAYSIANVFDEEETIRNEAALIGTSYAKASYRKGEEPLEYMKDGEVITGKARDVSEPCLEPVNFFSLFLPPGTRDFYKSKYYIYRTIGALGDYKKQYEAYGITWKDEELLNSSPISTKDYSRAYECKNYGTNLIDRLTSGVISLEAKSNWMNEQIYYIDLKKNRLVECVEYYEGNSLAILINGKIVYNGINPLPGKPYFQCVIYEKQPGTYRGRGIGQKLLPLQKEVNLIHNGVKDAITMGLYPMFLVPKGTMKDSTGKAPAMLYWKPSAVVEVTNNIGNAGIEPLKFVSENYISLGRSQMEFILAQAQEVIGVNSYASGGAGKVERSSTGVNARVAVIRARLQPIISSLNRFTRELFQQWMSQATIYLDDTFKARIVGESGAEIWKDITISDILNKFDIIAENEANRLATKELRATQSLDALAKMRDINLDPITGLPIYDLEPAVEKVAENFNFEALKKIDPELLKKKMAQRAEWNAILNPQPAQTAPVDPSLTGLPPIPGAVPSQTPTVAEQPASVSGFVGDLYQEPNRLAAQI